MAQDIRKLFEQEPEMATEKLPKGHKSRFESKLEFEFPQHKNNYSWMKIAASIAIVLSLGIASYQYFKADIPTEIAQEDNTKKINSMGDISPDLKKIEDFYLANINYRISKIKVTDENRDLLAAYFSQLSVLQQEYSELNLQLDGDEISEETIDALIENLQMRLVLLKQLKKKLNEIDNLNLENNENNQA